MSLKQRAYLYRGLTFVLAVLAGFDLIADSNVPVWATAGAAVLGLGTAAAHTPRRPRE